MNWAIWRPVLANLDSLTNIETQWSLEDLLDSHEALDIKGEVEKAAMEAKK